MPTLVLAGTLEQPILYRSVTFPLLYPLEVRRSVSGLHVNKSAEVGNFVGFDIEAVVQEKATAIEAGEDADESDDGMLLWQPSNPYRQVVGLHGI
jgi:hypothetical protein